jgi:CDP-diacylglycerol--serine O-phosphatidyltransferase
MVAPSVVCVAPEANRNTMPLQLKKTLFLIPNMLTAASLAFGLSAIFKCVAPDATDTDVFKAAMLLFFAFIFDLFDGRVARMTKTQSSFGIEFDSLADLISFGVAPAVLVYRWALSTWEGLGMAVCILYVLGGAIRLARFNVLAYQDAGKNKGPSKYMLGLPIPMAASFIVALMIVTRAMGGWPWLTEHGLSIKGVGYPMIMAVMVVLAILMMSTVKFRSFKDLKLNIYTSSLLIIILGSSAYMWVRHSPAYIMIWLLCLYVALGFGETIIFWPRRHREKLAESPKEDPS